MVAPRIWSSCTAAVSGVLMGPEVIHESMRCGAKIMPAEPIRLRVASPRRRRWIGSKDAIVLNSCAGMAEGGNLAGLM